MKVALINTSDSGGGAAEACMRLLKALQLQDLDVTMVVQHKTRAEEAVYTVERNIFGRIRSRVNFLLERIPFMLFQERDKQVRFAFSPANAGTDISNSNVIKEADIIHLHWTNSGFLSTRDIKKLLALNKPVIWTLHDMWVFTGGCHYSGSCNHFINQCGNCYFLRNPEDDDLSHDGWLNKNDMLPNAKNLSIVTCSNWLGETAMKSSLLKGVLIQAIPNPIDTALFSPQDQNAAKARWGVNPAAKIILFGAANVNHTRKGINFLVQALQFLKGSYVSDTPIEVVIFGKNKHFDVTKLMFPVRELNVITSPADLAEIYSLADVFVSPAIEDNLPNMIMEAMSCGTPVVAFNTGGIPDLIDHQVNGYMAEFKSATDLAKGITEVLDPSNHAEYATAARSKILRVFNNEKVAGQYIDLYRSVLNPASV